MARPTLTIAILTKDEASHLRELLPTLNWADQILVIDDFSTDDSTTVARSHGARVYQRQLNNDFAVQRNYALEKASSDWVLFLDADERVSDQLAQEIQSVIKNPTAKGYRIQRYDYFMGRLLCHGEIASANFVRLGRRRAGNWRRPVHEFWDIQQTGSLHAPLVHYAHETVSDLYKSIDAYTTIEAQYRHSVGKSWTIVEQLIFPPAKFLWLYLFKQGFRDGLPGLVLSVAMAYHSWTARSKLFRLQHQQQGMWNRVYLWLLYCTVGLLSLGQLQRMQVGQVVAFNLFDITIAASVILWLIQSTQSSKTVRKWSILSSWIVASTAFALSYGIGMSSMEAPIVALLHLVRWCVYGLYGWHLYDLTVSTQYLVKPKQLLLLLVQLLAVWGLIQYCFFPDTRQLLILGWDNHYFRLISTLFDPGFVSILIVMGLLIIEGQDRSWKQPRYLTLLVALLLTFARSGYLAYSIVSAILHLGQQDLKNLATKISIGLVGLLLIPKPGGEGVNLTRTYSIETRVQSSMSALDIGLEHPLFGVGFNAYAQYGHTDSNPAPYQIPVHPSAPDNSFLFVFATAGLVGLLAFMYLIIQIGQVLRSDLGSIAAFGAIVLHSFTNNTLFYPWILIAIWLLVANTAIQKR